MVEFTGYLTGTALRQFNKNALRVGQNIVLGSIILFFPFVVYLSFKLNIFIPIYVYFIGSILILLLIRIPKRKKEQLALTPKRIYTDDTYIVCVADKYEETRSIEDAKVVYDHGEFYEFVFPFGKVSEKFICQKDLLTKGTLEDFEMLFKDKLVKKT